MNFYSLSAPAQFIIINLISFLILNIMALIILKLILPWQAMRLLKKISLHIKKNSTLPLLEGLEELYISLRGTITTGAPQLVDIFPIGITPGRLLSLVASAEQNIDNPIARAILETASEKGLELTAPTTANYMPGNGVEALINRQAIRIGKASFLEEQGIKVDASTFTLADQLASKGQTILFVAVGNYCRGFLTLEDPVRKDIPGAISFLKAAGLSLTVLSATPRSTVRNKCKRAGIEKFKGDLSPLKKATFILQDKKNISAALGTSTGFAGAMQSTTLGITFDNAPEQLKELSHIIILRGGSIGSIATGIYTCRLTRGIRRTCYYVLSLFDIAILMLAGFFYYHGGFPEFSLFITPILATLCLIYLMFKPLTCKL